MVNVRSIRLNTITVSQDRQKEPTEGENTYDNGPEHEFIIENSEYRIFSDHTTTLSNGQHSPPLSVCREGLESPLLSSFTLLLSSPLFRARIDTKRPYSRTDFSLRRKGAGDAKEPPLLHPIMDLGGCLTSTLDGAVVLDVEVQPGSTRQGVTGYNEWRSRLCVAVRAEAKQGRANKALVHVLATQLGLETEHVEVSSGLRSKQKSVRITVSTHSELLERIRSLLEALQ